VSKEGWEMSSLECVVSPDGADGELLLCVSGELDLATERELSEVIGKALAKGPKRLVVDMAGVSFFSSTGLRVLMASNREAQELGCELALRAVPAQAVRILQITGTEDYFQRC
jgi:anti-anti-sigma factor